MKCGHCHGELRGFAMAKGERLCHPDNGLDCYRLVTIWSHDMPCPYCHDVRVLEDAQRREGRMPEAFQDTHPILTRGLPNQTETEHTRFDG